MPTFKLLCECGSVGKCELTDAALRAPITAWAIVLKIMARREGWSYRGGRLAKSTGTAVCPKCVLTRKALRIEADFAPAEVDPGTHQDDLELWSS